MRSLNMLEGNLPAKALSLVREWAAIHQDELLTMWQTQNFKQLRSPKFSAWRVWMWAAMVSLGMMKSTFQAMNCGNTESPAKGYPNCSALPSSSLGGLFRCV